MLYERAVRAVGTGCELEVRAQPGAKRSAFAGEWNGLPKYAVTAPPEDGKANAALTELVADSLGLRPAHIELVRGATARIKVFRLSLSADEALRRLQALTND